MRSTSSPSGSAARATKGAIQKPILWSQPGATRFACFADCSLVRSVSEEAAASVAETHFAEGIDRDRGIAVVRSHAAYVRRIVYRQDAPGAAGISGVLQC